MSEKGTSLAKYVEHFGLEILNQGDTYDTDRIEVVNLNRPDLQILGLFDYFDPPPYPGHGQSGSDIYHEDDRGPPDQGL